MSGDIIVARGVEALTVAEAATPPDDAVILAERPADDETTLDDFATYSGP